MYAQARPKVCMDSRRVVLSTRGRRVWADLLCWGHHRDDCIRLWCIGFSRPAASRCCIMAELFAVVKKVVWMMIVAWCESRVRGWCNLYLLMSLTGVECCRVRLCIGEHWCNKYLPPTVRPEFKGVTSEEKRLAGLQKNRFPLVKIQHGHDHPHKRRIVGIFPNLMCFW